MPVVTEYLYQLIYKQVEEKRLVVWYDPQQAFAQAAAELAIPNTTIARYEGSFFKLRREIDHLLNDSQPPRLVVYVPLERTEADNALIELDCAGVIMQPGQQPPARNTRLPIGCVALIALLAVKIGVNPRSLDAFVLLDGLVRPFPVAFAVPPQSGEGIRESGRRLGRVEGFTELFQSHFYVHWNGV